MISAARLRPRNPKKGHGIRDYRSAISGTHYRIGKNGQPSPIKVVRSPEELKELGEEDQFQILTFQNIEELDAFIERETSAAHRQGKFIQRPVVTRAKRPQKPEREHQEAELLLDYDDDEEMVDTKAPEEPKPVVNTGRKPKSAESEENAALKKRIAELEAKEEQRNLEDADTEPSEPKPVETTETNEEPGGQGLKASEEAKESEEVGELRLKVAEMKEKYDEAIELGRKPNTVEKWKGRYEGALEELEASLNDQQL